MTATTAFLRIAPHILEKLLTPPAPFFNADSWLCPFTGDEFCLKWIFLTKLKKKWNWSLAEDGFFLFDVWKMQELSEFEFNF
jgi:hypothetical protein